MEISRMHHLAPDVDRHRQLALQGFTPEAAALALQLGGNDPQRALALMEGLARFMPVRWGRARVVWWGESESAPPLFVLITKPCLPKPTHPPTTTTGPRRQRPRAPGPQPFIGRARGATSRRTRRRLGPRRRALPQRWGRRRLGLGLGLALEPIRAQLQPQRGQQPRGHADPLAVRRRPRPLHGPARPRAGGAQRADPRPGAVVRAAAPAAGQLWRGAAACELDGTHASDGWSDQLGFVVG